MKVFISWSGKRSRDLAQALSDWLPTMLHYVEPWLSRDIGAGKRWAHEIAKELEVTKFGIICITRDNCASPWMLFEAGALSKFMQETRVIPLLLDMDLKEITDPLAQFQAKKVEKAGLADVVKAINQISEIKISESRLTSQFETLWPLLERKITAIPTTDTPAKQETRTQGRLPGSESVIKTQEELKLKKWRSTFDTYHFYTSAPGFAVDL
jgi:hypothetical protein